MTVIVAPPDLAKVEPFFARIALRAALARPPREQAFDTFSRYSAAGDCARAIALHGLHVPESDPIDDAGQWSTWLGDLIHGQWQEMVTNQLADDGWVIAVEVPSRHGDVVSGHTDILARRSDDGHTINIEGKTVGGFKYKMIVGAGNRPPEGPGAYVGQLALQTVGVGADEGRILVLSRECISVGQAARFDVDEFGRFGAEWSTPAADLTATAVTEVERMAGIQALALQGDLPRRVIPDLPRGAEVMSAKRGTWQIRDSAGQLTATGSTWRCDYCVYQELCADLGPGRVHFGDKPVTEIDMPGEGRAAKPAPVTKIAVPVMTRDELLAELRDKVDQAAGDVAAALDIEAYQARVRALRDGVDSDGPEAA